LAKQHPGRVRSPFNFGIRDWEVFWAAAPTRKCRAISEARLFSVVAAMVRAQVSLNLPKPVFDYIPGGLKRTGRMPVPLRLSIMFPGHRTRGWDMVELGSSLTWEGARSQESEARSCRALLVVGSSVENIRCDELVTVLALRELRCPAQRRASESFAGLETGHTQGARCAGRRSRSATLSTSHAVARWFLQSRLEVAASGVSGESG
jgi:hypothetical protein